MSRFFKIELIIILMILIMLAVSYLIKVKNDKAQKNISNKELEIFDSVSIEVNESMVMSRLYSDYALKENGELKMDQITYAGKTAKVLKSRYGKTIDGKTYLDENVSMLQTNGYYYKTEHAIYDKKNNFFYATSPFVAFLYGGNIIHGTNLKYDMTNEIVIAENVDAIFYTVE